MIMEHLFRRRVPTIVISQYQQAEAFMTKIPREVADRLEREFPGQRWKYGEDWINAGFKPGQAIFMQSLVKADDVTQLLAKDVNGSSLTQFPKFSKIGGIEHVRLVGEVTGLTGVFDNIIQFFQKDGYHPVIVHGCTSITIPEAYIFLDSGQLTGLLEGIAGAAWYSKLLKEANPKRANDTALVRNTALSVAHVVLIFLIVLGNVMPLLRRFRGQNG